MKKILAGILIIISILSFSSNVFASSEENGKEPITSDASENNNTTVGIRPASAEEISASNLIPDKEFITDNISLSRASTTILSGYIAYAQQEKNYCGPASLQAILRFLTGATPPTQKSIANACNISASGATIADMVAYANSAQSKNTYIARYRASSSMMTQYLFTGIAAYGAPPIVGLIPAQAYGFPYTISSGHAVSIYGATNDKTSFYVADPWIGYSGSGLTGVSMFYTINSSNLYTAYSVQNCGLMY